MQKDLFYYIYTYIWVCMSTGIEVSDSPGTGVTGDCNLPDMDDGN